jgi:hypothetical protein
MFHTFQLKGSGLYIAESGPFSEEHPVRMSEAITERICLQLQPRSGSSFKDVCTELAATMKESGTSAAYAGSYEEDRDAVDVLVCPSSFVCMLEPDVFYRLWSILERRYLADHIWCSLG